MTTHPKVQALQPVIKTKPPRPGIGGGNGTGGQEQSYFENKALGASVGLPWDLPKFLFLKCLSYKDLCVSLGDRFQMSGQEVGLVLLRSNVYIWANQL